MRVVRRRAIGRSVVRTAATTAVVVGTAHAVNNAMTPKEQSQQAQAPAEPEVVYVQAPPEQQQLSAPAGTDINSQLMQLSQLHNAGVLSDEEFTQAKAKLLAG
jgi:hypothetical protein